MSTPFRSLLLAAAALPATAIEQQANPIRKVVTMLQSMQKKVEQEGKTEKELYDKFMCYCKTGNQDLDSSITAATDKIAALTSSIEGTEARLAQAKDMLKQAQSDRSAAKTAMADATALREKEAATYAQYKSDADTNIAAIAKAVAALEKGMAGGFLQTPAGAMLRTSLPKFHLGDADYQTMLAFLSGGSQYAPQSGEVTGILKQMGDTMDADLAATTTTEQEAIKTYEGLMAAKAKEVAANTQTIEAKTQQIGELGVSIVQQKDDLADTNAALSDDQKFLVELKNGCATKTAEWEERSKMRADELVALAETIKVLNDDDALELFKKTLPSASSLVQVAVTDLSMRDRALTTIRAATAKANKGDRAGLELLSLALAGKRSAGGFGKVIKMIDNMVDVLKKEQRDDDDKKDYCSLQLDSSDDAKKALERKIKNEDKSIATTADGISTLTDEIAALTAGIKALDKSVAEATEQRKEENTEFKELIASDSAATDILNFAKNRLHKFYNPKLYKPAPKAELSREDRIFVNQGNPDDLVTTAAPGGIANTGVTAFVQLYRKEAPPAPPATWNAYSTKSQENNGVIAMMDLLIADLAKEMATAETDEKNAQAEYEDMMKDASEKRRTDSKSLTDKGAAKADLEESLEAHKEAHTAGVKDLMAQEKYIASLHSECDWLMQYFDVRKEARAGEVDSLVKAKAVLSGADFALVQKSNRAFLRRA